jgi:hypothetical protein
MWCSYSQEVKPDCLPIIVLLEPKAESLAFYKVFPVFHILPASLDVSVCRLHSSTKEKCVMLDMFSGW